MELWKAILIAVIVILGVNLLFKSLKFIFRILITITILLLLWYLFGDTVVGLLIR